MNVEVNYLAVLIAAVAFMVVGFLWYSPMLFAKQWMKLKGYTAESMKKAQKEMGKWYAVSFVLALITAYVLSHVMTLSQNFFNYAPVMTGVTTAFFMWLGFVMPVQMTGQIFGEKKWSLFAIDTGYQLTGMLVMGVVLGLLS
jgi:hypothetical protein